MSNSALAVFLLGSVVGQYPDALDHLRAGDVTPQVGLLLDKSCSMGWGDAPTTCDWFANQCPGGPPDVLWGWGYCSSACPCDDFVGDCDNDSQCKSGNCAHDVGPNYGQGATMDVCEPSVGGGGSILNKSEQMKAALVGCRNPNDGILDKWASRINFSVYEFGSNTGLKVPFDSDLATLEAGVMAIPASGSTYMTKGIKDHAKYFGSYFNGTNSLQCRPNFLVILSDGNPNGGASTYDFECTTPVESTYVNSNQPWFGADYIYRNEDVLCNLGGNQNIRTYSIGFGQPGDFSPTNLQNIADYGAGDYFYASDVNQLSDSFEKIISSIVSRSALFFAPIAIQSDSLFAGNFAYTASFRPQAGGPWKGSVKKHCVVPPAVANGKYDTSVDTCLFVSSDGVSLETNPEVMDQWTGVRSIAADVGGAGEVIIDQMGSSQGGAPVAPYHGHRNIVTWRAGATGYTPVAPATWNADDSWTNGCEHARLMNYLHGYTMDADCGTGDPVAVGEWPLGDPVHFAPVLLSYGPCQDSQGIAITGACFVVSGMNDGMVHIFDAADGRETTAFVPAELWKPTGIARSPLSEIADQPSPSFTHRYYVDGGSRLMHVDSDADGYIDANEKARLIFGLGRGGRAYYQVDVAKLTGGVLNGTDNPVFPLTRQAGSGFESLESTWASPWVGRMRSDGTRYDVAVFPSGHVPNLDFPKGINEVPKLPDPGFDLTNPRTVNCEGSKGFSQFNGHGQTSAWCDHMWFNGCNGNGNGNNPCYDAGGVPLDIAIPIAFNDGAYEAAAIRIRFRNFDIGPNDVVRIEDAAGNVVGSFTGTSLDDQDSPWVIGDSLVVRLITDGVDSTDRGFSLKKLDWVAVLPGEESGQAPGRIAGYTLGVDHRPSVFAVDVDRWNGAARVPYAASVDSAGVVLRVTNDCNGFDGDRCIDKTDFPVLANMICPISAEVSSFTEGDELKAMYWGDECAQIWKAWTDDAGDTWKVKRLVNLNGGATDVTKDHRKIFRRLDLVLSTCPGKSVVGVYFGTGNIQHPVSQSDLADSAITNGRDIVGVIWDMAGLPTNLTEADLFDVTQGTTKSAFEMVAAGKYGWRVDLRANERMLRDPLVFDGAAFFKTFEPTAAAAECGGSSGLDRIYSMNNCDGGAMSDIDGDGSKSVAEREVWSGNTDGGGNLFFFTPKGSPVLVSHADVSTKQAATLNRRQRSRPGLFLWREY